MTTITDGNEGSLEQGVVWRNVFIGLLGFHILIHVNFGYQMLQDPAAFFATTGIPFQAPTRITDFLYLWIGLAQTLLISTAALGIYGAIHKDRLGVMTGVVLGGFFVVLGAGLVQLAMVTEFPLVGGIFDAGRGLLTVVFGALLLRKR